MPRARLSVAGPKIAMAGYDVDTAPTSKMVFTPDAVAMRLRFTGTLSVSAFSGFMSDYYYQGVGYFPETLTRLPIVLVAGINADGSVEQRPFMYGRAESASMRVTPSTEVRVFLDRVELSVLVRWGPAPHAPILPHPPTWKYFVFENTLDAS